MPSRKKDVLLVFDAVREAQTVIRENDPKHSYGRTLRHLRNC